MKLKKAIPYDILIRPSANNGFIVKIGCGEFVAETKSTLKEGLNDYLDDPDKYVQDYNKNMAEEIPAPTEGESANENTVGARLGRGSAPQGPTR